MLGQSAEMKEPMEGGKSRRRRTKSKSKSKSTKKIVVKSKGSKKSKSKSKGSKVKRGGRGANPAFAEAGILNKKVRELLKGQAQLGQMLVWIKQFREKVKKTIKDPTDYKKLNEEILDLIKEYVNKHGLEKTIKEVSSIEIKKKSKKSKK